MKAVEGLGKNFRKIGFHEKRIKDCDYGVG